MSYKCSIIHYLKIYLAELSKEKVLFPKIVSFWFAFIFQLPAVVCGQSDKRKLFWSSQRSSPSFFSTKKSPNITDSSTIFSCNAAANGNATENLKGITTLVWPKAPDLLPACRALGKTLQKAADFLVISKLCNGRTVMQAFAGLLGGNIPNWFWYMCEYRLQQCDRCPNGKECQRLEGVRGSIHFLSATSLIHAAGQEPSDNLHISGDLQALLASSTSNKLDFLISVPVQPVQASCNWFHFVLLLQNHRAAVPNRACLIPGRPITTWNWVCIGDARRN